ncbi:GGDEF domain-containing protein [Comamonas terrigena]|jgi:diguanylate cyclase (GGDEF)-like protein|uniref:GGDEF domain-containing protein n=1 Tax=Comamonas terrigena TaxID=32013 RepID=UPI00244A1D42|nr:diguanylate cyclase [Comamonas terrigena]MDH0050682.1 diguanylate cyclase [Comamonas terrigena]MDH0513138.1 diguanylate cyclase [Comamonas terrigena]MDH1092534.1 diguanylate cyclase [Comamonas terrigena]
MTPPDSPANTTDSRLLWGPEAAGDTDYAARWRRRTWQLHGSVVLSHLYALLLFVGHAWAGYAPWQALGWYALWIGAGMGFITWAYASGWSQTRRDPGMFLAHQLIAISGTLGLWMAAPQVAFQAMVMLLAFSADGFLARRRTSFWMTWGCTLVAVAVIVYVLGPQMRMTTDTPAGQLLAVAVMVGGVFRCSLLVTYFRGMQYRLRGAHDQLAGALARIESLARSDELTGVANRRGVMERLQQAQQAVERQGTPLCVALLDIDHFKQINDRYGHDGGDTVLRAFGQLLAAQVRAIDCVGRYGGEEFLLVLPGTTPSQAQVLLERVRQHIAELPWAQLVHADLQVHCTVGLSAYRLGEPTEAVISRADAAMYAGKAAGRNRIVLEDAPALAPAGLPPAGVPEGTAAQRDPASAKVE